MREIKLKVRLFESVSDFNSYISNDIIYEKSRDGLCFGITENNDSHGYHFTFHYEDQTSYIGRT